MKIDLLSLYVNDSCNFDCVYCYLGKSSKKGLMTFEEQKRVIKEAKSLGAGYVLIAGKEPMLYDKITDLISYIRSLGLYVLMFTNGANLDKELVRFLYDSKVQVHFKLDSLDKKVYGTLVNKKPSHKWVGHKYNDGKKFVKKKIPLPLKLLIDQSFDKRQPFPSLIIEVCVNKLNYESIPELAEFCKSNNIKVRIERLIAHGSTLGRFKELCLSEKENGMLFSKLKGILGGEFMSGHESGECLLRYNPVVFEDGSIGFCLVERPTAGYLNIKDLSLREAFENINKVTSKVFETVKDNFKICPGRLSCLNSLIKK